MAKITLVIGGARSGKSSFAEGIARQYTDVTYIATAEQKDDEMRERIRIHRLRRPPHWKTVESPFNVHHVIHQLKAQTGLILIDCVTLYISNMLLYKNEKLSAFTDMGKNVASQPFVSHETEKSMHMVPSTCNHAESLENPVQDRTWILAEIDRLGRACRRSGRDVILVSNEVGFGIVPGDALSRIFRDIVGNANQMLAREADEVYFLVAGIPQRIK